MVYAPQAVLLFVFFLAYYYASDREHSIFAKIIFFVGVVLVLLCIALVPLDIYNTSHTALELVAERARYISIAYYGAHVTIARLVLLCDGGVAHTARVAA